jgi:alkylhydroperoxidase family enzyme
VHRHAYRVVDADVEALRDAGWSEEAIFELTIAAALGAGLRRLELP